MPDQRLKKTRAAYVTSSDGVVTTLTGVGNAGIGATVHVRAPKCFDVGVPPHSPLATGAGQTGKTITTHGWNVIEAEEFGEPDAHLGARRDAE